MNLEGLRVSNSRLGTWRRCQKKYEYKYIMGLEPRAKVRQLEMGSWMHELLETHYNGDDWKAKHKENTNAFFLFPEEVREELGDLPTDCNRLMRSYLRYWKEDDKKYVVVDTELDEIVTLKSGLEFRMIIDLIVENKRTGKLEAWDHKNRKNFASGDSMILDPQLTNYFAGLEIMGYTPLGCVMYNEIKTKAPTVPRLLKTGGLSQAKNIDTDVYTYYRTIQEHGFDPDDYSEILRHLALNETDRFFKRTRLPKDPPMIKRMMREAEVSALEAREKEESGEPFVRSFDATKCSWDCSYTQLCIAELYGADISSAIKSGFRKRGETDEVEESNK